MRRTKAFTLVELMVVVGIIGLLAAILVPALQKAQEMTNRAVCMGNLGSINKGLVVYKAANEDKYPWLFDKITTWGTLDTGENRDKDPFKPGLDPNNPTPRAITTLMFMMVRDGQAPGIFRCPSDKDSVVDDQTQAGEDDGDISEGDYYWDFSEPENVSFSIQAPRWVNGSSYDQGIQASQTEMVMFADMTPKYEGDEEWKPQEIKKDTPQEEVTAQLSYNHQQEQVNVLKVAGNVKAEKRPDVGVANDHIYAAYGDNFKQRRGGSDSLQQHKKTKDTYLIGPVGRSEVTSGGGSGGTN